MFISITLPTNVLFYKGFSSITKHQAFLWSHTNQIRQESVSEGIHKF